jgi:hypothetical protein
MTSIREGQNDIFKVAHRGVHGPGRPGRSLFGDPLAGQAVHRADLTLTIRPKTDLNLKKIFSLKNAIFHQKSLYFRFSFKNSIFWLQMRADQGRPELA